MSKLNKLLVAMAPLLCGSVQAQTLTLSMDDAIASALDRNFAIRIERIEPDIAQEEVRSAWGRYDPVLESQYLYQRDEIADADRDQESASVEMSVGATLPWGTQIEGSIISSDSTTPFIEPTSGLEQINQINVRSFAGISVRQPVLRGFGLDGTHTRVRIARESAEASWQGFRARVMDTVQSTIAAYQRLYFAQENLLIAERNRDLAVQLLKDNRKRVETGAMAPLDIVQAESEAALREVSVISARALLKQAQNGLKQLVWDNPESVLDLNLEILPPEEPSYFDPDLARDYQLAIENLPEYSSTESGLRIRQWQVREARRNALPQLDLTGTYGHVGIRDELNDSLSDAFGTGEKSYSVGAVLSIPFPNRSRSAERTQAYLRRNQAKMELTQLEQSIRIELDNASTQLKADWERIQAARKARELSEKSLKAEEKKLQAGTSTTFVVLRLQGDLAIAEIRETNALADYSVSLARYHRARGKILDIHNISLEGSRN
jgi:outer membrane protein TolC